MHNFRNISSSFLRSLTCSGLVSALALASSLVSFSQEAFCDVVTNTIPTGPFEGDFVLTNITFSTPEQLLDYRHWIFELADSVYYYVGQVKSQIVICSNSCVVIVQRCDTIDDYVDDYPGDPLPSSVVSGVKRQTGVIRSYADTGVTSRDNVPYQLSRMDSNLSSLSDVTDYVTNVVDTYTLYNATYASAAFADSSGGEPSGCSCPDYTSILQAISTSLSSILNVTGTINSNLSNCSTYLDHIDANVYTIETYISEIYPILESISAAFVPIATDTTNISYFLTETLWEYLQSLYQQIDLLRADVELGFSAVTNRMLLPDRIFMLNRWLGDSSQYTYTRSPLAFFGDFFGTYPIIDWGPYDSFREFLEFGVLDSIAYLNGTLDSSWLDDPSSIDFFLYPLVSVVSNFYATARPELVQSRSFVYNLWAQGLPDDVNIPGMPSGLEVANQPIADAVIGLLYRIQYLLSGGSTQVDSNQVYSVLQDIPPDARQYAQAVGDLDFIIPSTTNIPFLRVYSTMKASLENLKSSLNNFTLADTWLVLYEDGFSIQFTGSTGDPLVTGTSAPIYLTQPDFEGSHQSFFVDAVSSFMGVVWYGVCGLVALVITLFAFRFFWICTTFTIAVIGGDFSSAIAQFADVGKVLTGGGD